MKKVFIVLLLMMITGCGYRTKGYSISCEHPDGRSHYVSEHAGLSKTEYQREKEKYENMGYICE